MHVLVTGVVKMKIEISHGEKTTSQQGKIWQHDINAGNELIIGEAISQIGQRPKMA